MPTPEMTDDPMGVDMNTVDIQTLADIRTLELERSIPGEKRMAHVQKKLKNPVCFRCGDMGVKLEFDDGAPPLREVLASFLIRKKSGL